MMMTRRRIRDVLCLVLLSNAMSCGFQQPSEGMSREIAKAKKRGIPIKYYNPKCEVLEYGT